MAHDARRASERLFEQMRREESVDARMRLFGDLLRLQHGFWQAPAQHDPVTLKGFVTDVCRQVVHASYRRHGSRGNVLDVDELAQLVLLAFFDNAAKIDTPREWLFGTARNKAREAMRASRVYTSQPIDDLPRDREPVTADESWTDEPPSVDDDDADDRAHKARLLRAIDRLTPAFRAAIQGYLEGKTVRQIADEQHAKPNTIRQNIIRAKRKLRTLVALDAGSPLETRRGASSATDDAAAIARR